MPDVAWVDGWKGPLAAARISVQDRGFVFGDGAYEVLRAYEQRIFEMRAHLMRLDDSLRGLQMKTPVSRRALEGILRALLEESGYAQARIYIQVTRGAARREHLFRLAAVNHRWRQQPDPGVTMVVVVVPEEPMAEREPVLVAAEPIREPRAFPAGSCWVDRGRSRT